LKNALLYLLIIVSYFYFLAFGFWLGFLVWFSFHLVLLASAFRARATFGKPRGVLADFLLYAAATQGNSRKDWLFP